jgi:catechol 2,3-dioxygenase-like lactoylglutathione lyase family enzyme
MQMPDNTNGSSLQAVDRMIERIDHLVLTVRDVAITCEFYAKVLGMQVISFGDNRKALQFGQQKLNLHQAGQEFEPKAACPTPGAVDLCLITQMPLSQVVEHLQACGVILEAGIVSRTGALGKIDSIYFRDPDGNLLEISTYSPK